LHIFYLIQLFSINITGGEKSTGFVPTVKRFVKIAFNNFNNPYNDWDFRLYAELNNEGKKAVIWARTVLIFHIFVIIISFSIKQPILAVIISGHRFIGNWLYYFVASPMHCGLRTNVPDFRKCVRSITLDPISEFLYWNMNWHLEHHMYASIPCYNLKKINRLISIECPKPKNIFGAWKEMREIYSEQQNNSKYEFDTLVPSTTNLSNSKQKNIDIEESLGDLVPKALN
jgi:fatty acid desaturase